MTLLLATVGWAQDQQAVSGRVTDVATGAALPYVTCKVVDAKGRLIAYTTTDVKGHYSLAMGKEEANAVVFSLIGYAKQTFKAPPKGCRLDVAMKQEHIQVKEVIVTSKPVMITGDTVKYNVASFAGKGDQYIEDVLKRLPGIEVKEDGNISYKGKNINKLLIEGHDLLGNRYNQATQNLPVEAVAQVQVVENDQPIQALKGILNSDRATLNLKLKSGYKTRPFGEIVLGGGVGNNDLYDNKLTCIALSRRWQALLAGRMVNNGTNISSSFTPHMDVMDPEGLVPSPKAMLAADNHEGYSITEERFLKNRSQAVGLNGLVGWGKYAHLRTNVSYFGTSDKQNDSTANVYGGAFSFPLEEANRRKKRLHDTRLDMTFELNAPNVFLSNALSVAASSCSNVNTLHSNAQPLGEESKVQPLTVSNHLGMNIKKGWQLLNLHSLLRFIRRSERLDVDSGHTVPDGFTLEKLTYKELFARNSLTTSVRLGRKALGLKYLMEYKTTWLDVVSPGSARASIENRMLVNSLQAQYTMKYSSGNVDFTLPLQWFSFRGWWNGGKEESTEICLAPVVSWKHHFSPFLSWNMRGTIHEVPLDDGVVGNTHLFVSYRNMIFLPLRLSWKRTSSMMCTLNYTNLINMITCNVLVTFSGIKSNCYEDFLYTPSATYIRTVWDDNFSRVLYGSMIVSKSWMESGLAVNLSANYNRNERKVAQNGLKSEVKQNIFTVSAHVMYDKIEWMDFRNTFTFNIAWQDRTHGHVAHTIRSFFNELRASFYPAEPVHLVSVFTPAILQTSQGSYSTNVFMDLTARYKLNKRWAFSLAVTNLLNRKQYVEASFSGLNLQSLSLPLRGREVLVKVSFKM